MPKPGIGLVRERQAPAKIRASVTSGSKAPRKSALPGKMYNSVMVITFTPHWRISGSSSDVTVLAVRRAFIQSSQHNMRGLTARSFALSRRPFVQESTLPLEYATCTPRFFSISRRHHEEEDSPSMHIHTPPLIIADTQKHQESRSG